MPDPNKESVSGTQVAELYNVSPYGTRWTLFQNFNGLDIPKDEDARMDWGKRMQPLILEAAAEELKLEVDPIEEYIRLGPVGVTGDARAIDPTLGPGSIECKCCFDYRVWMETWAGGAQVPPHIDLQHQTQMFVGDGKESYQWGKIVVWLAGELHIFDRKPIPKLQGEIAETARQFLVDVEHGLEPPVAGAAVEIPYLAEVYPQAVEGKVIELDDEDLAEDVRLWDWAKAQRLAKDKTVKDLQAKIIAAAKDASVLRLPLGVSVNISKCKIEGGTFTREDYTRTTLNAFLPKEGEAVEGGDRANKKAEI